MEMALWPQSPLCPWSRLTLLIRPTVGFIGGGGGGFPRPFLCNSRYFRTRIIRCIVASSDWPTGKSRRAMSPKVRVASFRGYTPRFTGESSTKQREHHDSDEEAIDAYNRMLSTDAPEWTGRRKVESNDEDSLQNASSTSTLAEVDATEEAGLDISEDDLPGEVFNNKSIEQLDKDETEEENFDVDLSTISLELEATNEAMVKNEISEVDLAGHASGNVTLGEVNAVYEPKTDNENFEVVLGVALDSAGVLEVDAADEAKSSENSIVEDLPSVTGGEVDAIDEAKSKENIFLVDLPINPLSNLAVGEVDIVDKVEAKEDILGFSLPETAFSSAPQVEVIAADEAKVKKDISTASFSGTAPNTDATGIVKAIDEAGIEHDIVQVGLLGLSLSNSTAGEVELMDEVGSVEEVFGFRKQDTSIIVVPKQPASIIGFRKPDQSIVGLGNQYRSIVPFHEQKQSIVHFRKQDLAIVGTSREVQTKQVAIVDSLLQKDKEDIIEEVCDVITSKEVDEQHLLMIEEKKITSVCGDEHLVNEEVISVAQVQMKMDEIELLHLLPGEGIISQAGDEVGIIEDEEQREVDETCMSVELGSQESEADVNPQAHQRMLQEIAEKNHSLGNMLFLYPEVVKADSTIDLFLNRDLSALANEPDVFIKGAFNGWRWRPFTERLHKSDLGGDWWCCQLHIPQQAYRLDFVFFNGRTVYENNGNNDFVLQIESDMDELLFADFLDEEKQKEFERLATEEVERRRQIDDQRRREEERAIDEAVRVQAKADVGMKEKKLRNVLGLAKTSVDDLWYIEPITIGQGSTIRLYYNRSLRSLAHSTEIWIHGGYNNWIDGLSFAERLAHDDDKYSEWWFADVVLPERAYVLDWVFADGPPGNARNFDNNGRQDFHAILPNNKIEVEYWMEEEQRIYTRLLQERREREEAIKRKAELSAKMKAETKEKTMRMFLVSQKHIVYTEPLEIRAGTTVDVLYNPSNTVLNGKPEVWFRCSFNHWMYPGGVLPPRKMVTAENGSHLKATVNVPADAYVMDFVFSESKEGGIYDNRNGLDYCIPVFGSTGKEPPMHIVHIAVEMAPIAKVGGLGDVVTSLSRAVQDLGHKVEVILPKHNCLNLGCVRNLHVHQSFSWGGTEIRVWSGLVEDVSVYFLEPQNGIFGVGCVYGRNDDRRFGFFCHSALEFLHQSGSSPYIIHCHDWSSAPVAWLCKEHYAQSCLADARVVFTIHNLEFGAHYIGRAMKYCDKATTVSNTYSREVSGHSAIVPHLGKFFGILNGIDPDIWDPYNDNFIPVEYTSENVVDGKSAAKRALQQKLGLQQIDVPLVGIITRLTAQKGIHLIKHGIHHILERNGQVVLLGSAPDHRIQNDFCNLANTLHGVNFGRVRLCLTYDEPLSHLIYAGSDFILVPSIFEPCGLTQLVAMRYGSIPIVRKTGGLYDTVFDVEHDKDRARARGLEPNGFSFDGADTNGVEYALNRAITAWFDAREWFHSLCKRVMQQDWSWNRPALDYIELYRSASKF